MILNSEFLLNPASSTNVAFMDNFTFRCDYQKDYNVHEMNGIYFQPDMLDFFIKVII